MHGVALLVAAAALGHILARALRVPSIPLLLLAGVAVARTAHLPPELVEDALVLGVSFLLFVSGLELDPRRMRAQRAAARVVGGVQFVVLAGVGVVAALGLGYSAMEAGYLGVALTASSTLVGLRLLQRRGRMYEPYGRLTLGVLLLQDLLVLASIPLLMALEGGVTAALPALVGLIVLGSVAAAGGRWLAPLFLRLTDDSEALLLASLMLLFAFTAAGSAMGLPIIVGAFLAGVTLARFPVNGAVRIELAPVGDFFTALFFTALGALVTVPSGTELLHALLLGTLVIAVTVPLVAWLAERRGFAARSAVEAGLLLAQTSEISLVIVLAGLLQGHIGEEVFTVVTLVTMGTMLLTPFLANDAVAWRLVHLHPARRRPGGAPRAENHVLLLGAGSTGMPLLEDLILTGCRVVVVDDDPGILARVGEAGVQTVRGDASDPVVLERAGASRARVVCSTIRRPRDNEAVLSMTETVPVLVRVFDRGDADWVRERGGTPILYSEATAEGLLQWYREQADALEERLRSRESRGVAAAGGMVHP